MDYKELKKALQEIVKTAQGVPEEFRVKCFEVLLGRWIDSRERGVSSRQDDGQSNVHGPQDFSGGKIPNPPVMKGFMRKTGVTQQQLAKVLIYEEGEVHFISEPRTQTTAEGAVQWALLLALRNAISGGSSFEVDPEDLRSLCQEKDYYDRKNFWGNFASRKNAALFSAPLKSQGDTRRLSDAGKDELGRLIANLAEQ